MIWGVSMLRAGRPAEALGALEYALARNPTSTTLRVAYAEAALAGGDDVACERALDASTDERADVDELRAALRRARCELPTNNAMAWLTHQTRTTPGQWESAVRLLLELDQLDDAERLVRQRPAGVRADVVRVLAAQTATARRDTPGAIAAWQEALKHDPALAHEAFEAMLELGAAGAAEAIARSVRDATGSSLLLGRLALYRRRLDEAQELLLGAPLTVDRAAALAALALLRGEADRALTLLAGVARGPREELLYVEALRRAERVREAVDAFRALSPQAVARVAAAPLCRIASFAASEGIVHENAELLAALRRDFPDIPADLDPLTFATTAIDALSGNWGAKATRPEASGGLRFQPIARPVRERVAALRGGLHGLPFPFVIRQYEALEREVGAHPLIATYGAELLLWWGDYPSARAWLDRALELDELTRWAYIGTAILENATGRPEAALAAIARQRERLPALPNSYVCTAEAHLRLGDTERARVDYELALAAHPTRVSAWLGLGLALCGRGDDPQEAIDHVQRLTPVFFRQWQREAAALDPAARIDHALTMLRGNRGSDMITWWTRDGVFHGENVKPAPPGASALSPTASP